MAEASRRRVESRERILTAAGKLFRERGFDGVGVDAVMQEAGLTHGGFYLHFPSKEALAAEVSRSLLEAAARRWDGASGTADKAAAFDFIVRGYLDPTHLAARHSCPLTTLGSDVARRPLSKEAISGALHAMLDALERCQPVPDRDQAMTTLSTMVGAVVLARIADDPALAEAFLIAAADHILPPQMVNRSASTDESLTD